MLLLPAPLQILYWSREWNGPTKPQTWGGRPVPK